MNEYHHGVEEKTLFAFNQNFFSRLCEETHLSQLPTLSISERKGAEKKELAMTMMVILTQNHCVLFWFRDNFRIIIIIKERESLDKMVIQFNHHFVYRN